MSLPTPQYLNTVRTRQENLRAFLDTWATQNATRKRILEIGCGHGHFLAAYAATNPDHACLGIDLINYRIRLGQKKQTKRQLDHLAFLQASAADLLLCAPENLSFDRIFILYPDPWPKQRHTKHRLLQTQFLQQLRQLSHPGTALCFRTDSRDYFDWATKRITNCREWHIDATAPWPFEATSFFEKVTGGIAHSLIAIAQP